MLHVLPIRWPGDHRESYVYTRLASGQGQWLGGPLHTGDASVPPVRLFGDRDRLGCPVQWAMQPNRNTPNLGQPEDPAVQHGATMRSHLGIGEAVVALFPLEPWIAW